MEFSYRISEDDYVRGCKLAMKSKRPAVLKTILFWALIVIGLVLVFSIVQKSAHISSAPPTQSDAPTDTQSDAPAPQTSTANALTNIAMGVGPFIIILAVWGFVLLYWVPNATRRQYRKDTNSHGTLTIALDAESFKLQSSVGTSFQSGWNAFTGWQEKDGIVLLRYPAGTYQFVNVSGLSEPEREEIRSILKVALPGKN